MKSVPSLVVRRLSGALALAALAAAAPAAPVLSSEDRAAIYQAAGLRADGAAWRREGCATPLNPDTELLDLDGDGQPEVLLYLGPSACFAGGRAGNVALFMKERDAGAAWTERLGFVPGVEVVRQETAHAGLPDLGVANPGGCMPIYRWDGRRYEVASQKALQPGGCQFRE
jgi:hypothetical protein